MSWLRTAVNRAVEAGGRNNLTRTVRNYADSVVHQAGNAVAEGAKILQDRIGGRGLQNFKQAVKRLEEVSVSCRGEERILLLRRWLVALKEIERMSAGSAEKNNVMTGNISNDSKNSPERQFLGLVYYHDSNLGGEPLNFRDVFLHSQALEGVILSMIYLGTAHITRNLIFSLLFRSLFMEFLGRPLILEAPNEEEVSLLLELCGVCLTGGKDIHSEVVSRIQDLAKTFSCYKEEVLVKREELLQYAQGAISGLKLNADLVRIDSETFSLKEKLDKTSLAQQPSYERPEKSSLEAPYTTKEYLEEVQEQIQLCSTLEALLLRRKSLKIGDSPNIHAEKVDKLKILSESLANSSSKAEKRISDHRSHKEEAVNFRVAKTEEISQLEKELTVEIEELEKQKENLEFKLKKVDTSLTAARLRLHNAREEREQFDEASNDILVHLKSKEDELSRSVLSYRVEADVVNTWIDFLEHTWTLQTSYIEKKEQQINNELERCGDHFVSWVIRLLSAYKEELDSSLPSIKNLAKDLGQNPWSAKIPSTSNENPEGSKSKRKREEEYLDLEMNFLTAISMVEAVQKHFYIESGDVFRKDSEKVEELFDALKKMREEFESIERPRLHIETPSLTSENPPSDRNHGSSSPTSKQDEVTNEVDKTLHNDAKTRKMELECAKTNRDHLGDESGEWEFDELEQEFRAII